MFMLYSTNPDLRSKMSLAPQLKHKAIKGIIKGKHCRQNFVLDQIALDM